MKLNMFVHHCEWFVYGCKQFNKSFMLHKWDVCKNICDYGYVM